VITPSVIELSNESIQHNIRFLRKFIKKGTLISSVVKGNAYGHGIELYVPAAEEAGITHFSVFSLDEAKRVCKVKSSDTEVMIMGWIPDDEMEWVIANDISFWVFDFDRLDCAIAQSKAMGKKALLHIELETGMNRTGFDLVFLRELIKVLNDSKDHYVLKGLCTHFAGAESIANHVRVQKQFKIFKRLHKIFLENDLQPERLHAASSAATITYPNTQMDMVRIGILQYGYWPSTETFIHYISRRKRKADPIKRIITWKSRVMVVKEVKQGSFVSYGTTYLATEDKLIAVIPTGYSHGYSRSLSNTGRILINGQRIAVIGMVNMNMLIADITYCPDIKQGDEVVLIGRQGELDISVSSFSELSDQLNYELLARLPSSIERKLIQQ
jgi:alanine racemase